MNDLEPLPLVCYASGVDVTGYSRHLGDPPLSCPTLGPSRSGGPPEARLGRAAGLGGCCWCR
jgi:hypothetical protein